MKSRHHDSQRTGLNWRQLLELRGRMLFFQDFKCAECPNDLSKPEPNYAHLHHKDGDSKNNTESNLSVLCLNCHLKNHNSLNFRY
jgi:5-methylcytosine-specific restriction endonuclease McrA